MKGAELNRIRADFPNLACQIHGHPLVYLDNAATTMKPTRVIEAISNHYLAETANVHRGAASSQHACHGEIRGGQAEGRSIYQCSPSRDQSPEVNLDQIGRAHV